MRSELRDAVAAVTAGLEMPALLTQVVGEAAALVDARYGALGVVGLGWTTDQFVFTGVDDADRAAIGGTPAMTGLLGRLRRGAQPLRLHRVADDPLAAGFPAGHPPMTTFLGTSLRVGDQTLGILYLTDKRGGGDFTAADAMLVETFAAAAGVAISHASLLEQGRRRQAQLEALDEIRAALLSGSTTDDALTLIAARAREITTGDAVLLLRPDPADPDRRLVVAVADGAHAGELRGLRTPVDGSVAGRVYGTGEPTSVVDVRAEDTFEPAFDSLQAYGPATFAPLGGPRPEGVLIVAKLAGSAPLSADQTDFVTTFAGQAALALRMDEAHRTKEDLALLADRERIARDLHDQVIQRLFATGMGLESLSRQVEGTELRTKLLVAVDALDETVRHIRHTIFELHAPIVEVPTLRQQIGAVLDLVTAGSQLKLDLHVADSVDAVVPQHVAAHALVVLGEAATNVVRHSRAAGLSVSVTATDRLRIQVTDDGVGIPGDALQSGLLTLADRAGQLGGELTVGRSPTGGGSLTWDVPLPQQVPAMVPSMTDG